MPRSALRLFIPALAAVALATPALAQSYPGGGWNGGWNGPGGGSWPGDRRIATQGGAEPSRQIDVETFRTPDAADQLGKGRIVVTDAPRKHAAEPAADTNPDAAPGIVVTGDPEEKLPVYEAAVIDQLAHKGYDVADAANPGQLVEVAVSKDVVIPEEARHKPVSGEMSVGVSNYGAEYGLAVAVDLSKPRKAIIATRIDVRIRDKATHRILWEGYAQGQSRATDGGADDTRIAGRLTNALFAKFPDGQVVQPADLPSATGTGGE